jgi:hypothetical protein
MIEMIVRGVLDFAVASSRILRDVEITSSFGQGNGEREKGMLTRPSACGQAEGCG